ncbi:MAG: hypothetical protein ACI4W2_07625, partial [Eubacterium sp.]
LIREGCDITGAINILSYMDKAKDNKGNEGINCKNFYKYIEEHYLCKPSKSFKNKLRDVRETKNEFISHKKGSDASNFTYNVFKEKLNDIRFVFDCLHFSDVEEEKKLEQYRKNIDSELEKYKHGSLSIEYLTDHLEPDEKEFALTVCSNPPFYDNFDQKNQVLYWTPFVEIKNYIDINLQKLIQYNKLFANSDNEFATASHVRMADSFKELDAFIGGSVHEPLWNELLSKANFIVGEDIWLNGRINKFIPEKLAGILANNRRKIFIESSTRRDMDRIERNLSGKSTPQEISNAKRTHNIMHIMQSRGTVEYLPPATVEEKSSEENILDILEENQDKMFVLLSNSASLRKKLIADNDMRNVILINSQPIYTKNLNTQCRIRKDSMILVFRFMKEWEKADAVKRELQKEKKENPEKPAKTIPQQSLKTAQEKTAPVSEKKNKVTSATKEVKKKPQPEKIIKKEKAVRKEIKKSNSAEKREAKPIQNTGDIVNDKDGNEYKLGQQLGLGGEGAVYKTDHKGIVAKIYHANHLYAKTFRKLELMCAIDPHIKEVCWPISVVTNQKQEKVGYLMPEVSGYKEFGQTVLKANSPVVIDTYLSGWSRLDIVELEIRLCKVIRALHEKGILIGDINPKNMMYDVQNPHEHRFMLVDCDSFQIHDPQKSTDYLCPVGTSAFTSPELYQRSNASVIDEVHFEKYPRTVENEDYSTAVLLFRLLMDNKQPFVGKNATDMEQAHLAYNFVFRYDNNGQNMVDGSQTPLGFRMMWNNVPGHIRTLFGKVFHERQDVGMDIWIYHLNWYARDLKSGKYSKELHPVLYWDNSDTGERFTQDFICDNCGKKRNMPKGRYEDQEKYGQPHLCDDCQNSANRLKKKLSTRLFCKECGKPLTKYAEALVELGSNLTETMYCNQCRQGVLVKCENCGKPFRINPRRRDNLREKGVRLYCDDCKQEVTVHCSWCGNAYTMTKHRADDIRRRRRNFLCDECRSDIDVECSECGRTFQMQKYYYEQLQQEGKEPVCSSCRSQWRR